jgi:TPR repeat protein
MYGYPDVEKTEHQKSADEQFIKHFSDSAASRKKAGMEFAGRGWYYLQQGDDATSMRRFNQSWLLDPGNYLPYWGFGVLLKRQHKAAEATPHFDKALLLIDDKDKEKPRLLADAAKAYVARGRDVRSSDQVKSAGFLEKARSLAHEVFKLDPEFGKEALHDAQFAGAYYFGDKLPEDGLVAANVAYVQGDYATALENYSALAERNVPEAQLSLGNMYRMGQGVPQDNIKAYMWYSVAGESGHNKGFTNRDLVAKQMTASQRKEAQKLSREWMEHHR